MRHFTNTLLLALSLSCASTFAGPAVGGGGVLIANQADLKIIAIDNNNILFNVNDISDIRLRSEDIVTVQDIYTKPSLTDAFRKTGEDMIMLDMSKKSPVLDVQLMDGSILDNQAILKAFQEHTQNEWR
jgi:hypothetical protein